MMIDSKFTSDLGQHYSREYVEAHDLDPELISIDFEVMFRTMYPGQVSYVSCAGFGNHAIAKTMDGQTILVYYIMNRQHAFSKDFILTYPIESLLENKDDYLFGEPVESNIGYVIKKANIH